MGTRTVGIALSIGLFACGESKPATPSNESPPATPSGAAEKVGAKGKIGAPETDFGFQSAHIVYKYSGFEEGTVDAWVDGGGKTVVLVRKMTKPAENRIIAWKNEQTIMLDLGTKERATSPFRAKDTELRLVGTNDIRQLEMAGYVKKPSETIAGQPCDVWHQPEQNVTLWRWKGVDLKHINGVMQPNPPIVEAQSVQLDVSLPPDLRDL